MITSLSRSATRVSTRSSGYVCLSCRAQHQLAEVGSRSASTQAPLAAASPATNKEGKDDAGTTKAAQLAIQNAFMKALQHVKIGTPTIPIEGDVKSGFKATIDIKGQKLETTLYKTAKTARSKAKLLAIEHIRQGSQTATDAISMTPTKQPGSERTESVRARRQGLRGILKGEGSKRKRSSDASIIRILSKNKDQGRPLIRQLVVPDAPLARRHDVEDGAFPRGRLTVRERLAERARRLQAAKDPSEKSKDDGASSRQLRARAFSGDKSRGDATRITKVRSKEVRVKPLEGGRTIRPLSLEQTELDVPTQKVPGLSYGLDRVLFNPGVYHVQDPRSRVYNFDPYLEKIIDPRNFDFAVLDEYRTPSADNTLSTVAEENNVKYFSSTSAITPVLGHLHFVLSNWRPLSFNDLSVGFCASKMKDTDITEAKGDFTKYFKSPQSIYLKPKQGGYAIDRAEDKAHAGLLSFVGQCLEKLFTVPKEVFEQYKKDSTADKPKPEGNGYHYTKFDSILVRSQLDAHDDRLPGTGIFDIKTRAVLPIRMDSLETNQEIGKNYEIKQLHGEFESFEREFFDMARATMMKYLLQARLGRMDGIFVAYHNIARMFGFQYLSIADMDKVIHGQTDPALGDAELIASLRILSEVFDHAVELYPNEPIRLYFESRKGKKDINVYVVPVTEEEIHQKHVDSQQQSNEYLARLNKTNNNPEEVDDAEEELLAEAVDQDAKAAAQTPASGGADSWLSTSSSDTAEAERLSEQAIATEDATDIDSLRDDISNLFTVAATISVETDVLQTQGDENPKSTKVRKMMLTDIANKTFRFGRDVEKLASTLKQYISEANATDEQDLKRLRKIVDDQTKVNEALFAHAETHNILTGSELKNLTSAQTLEEALRASTQRYTAPPRLAAFRILAQSRIDGELTASPPQKITRDSDWQLTYVLEDYNDVDAAQRLFVGMLKKADEAAMRNWGGKRLREYYEGGFFQQLMRISRDGGKWRRERERLDRERQTVVFEPRG